MKNPGLLHFNSHLRGVDEIWSRLYRLFTSEELAALWHFELNVCCAVKHGGQRNDAPLVAENNWLTVTQTSLHPNISCRSLLSYLCSIYFEEDNTRLWTVTKPFQQYIAFSDASVFFQSRCETDFFILCKAPPSGLLLETACWSHRIRPHR